MAIPLVKWKYWNHRSNCGRKGVLSLTFDQYKKKLDEAGIDAKDIGLEKGKYQLARYDDKGDYTPESCRFVTKEQNYIEQITNGGFKAGVAKKIGRTKKNHQGVAEMARKKSKPFAIKNPHGVVIEGQNLSEFCKKNNLNQGNIWCVINGLKQSSKGWTKC